MKLRAAILDWAGTTIDYGCRAPVAVLRKLFGEEGVSIGEEEAREGMGLLKLDQIRRILELPRVAAAWRDAHGGPPGEADARRMFGRFGPLQAAALAEYSGVIPGVAEAVTRMRSRGLKIGSTTGYTREMLDPILPLAAAGGYSPDCSVCPDEAGAGRPAPLMCYRNAVEMGVWPLWATVKIGDTPVDIEEGRNAGMWTIGVTKTGNEAGLTEEALNALAAQDRERVIAKAARTLRMAGAHFTVESVGEADEVLDRIEAALAAGERP